MVDAQERRPMHEKQPLQQILCFPVPVKQLAAAAVNFCVLYACLAQWDAVAV